ncbi:hypothetical protein OG500_11930 [Kitasatospora sp. NBC_01250]|uniref:hypothetical protein n=1 Tax=Kitasatospora sp. NBC_01250 TaxID=2903571 RepID=UPI002E326074|nr:hypothetical protein [Kitasatospora sp. NBC_01250]
MLRFEGAWRITVLSKNADFEQRAVVRGKYGAKVLPGVAGASIEVDMESWGLALEHLLWGRNWEQNLRTIPGPVTEQGGVRSQVLTSNDCHWPGKAMDYPNFVVRLDQVVAEKVERRAASGVAPVPAATQRVRTSTGSGEGFGAVPGVPGIPGVPGVPGVPVAGAGAGPAQGWRTGTSEAELSGAQQAVQPRPVPAWRRSGPVAPAVGEALATGGAAGERGAMGVGQQSSPGVPAQPGAGQGAGQGVGRAERGVPPVLGTAGIAGIPAERAVRPAGADGVRGNLVPGVRKARSVAPGVPAQPAVRPGVRPEAGGSAVGGSDGWWPSTVSPGEDLGSLIERELRADGS